MCYDWGFTDLSKKAESYEICFIPDNDYRGFLRRRVPGLEAQVAGGDFVDTRGKKIGKHNGYPFYTVGQRKGLGIAFGEPMYVTEIRVETNTVVLGRVEDLIRNGMQVYKLNPMKYESFSNGAEYATQIRYNEPVGTMARLQNIDDGKLEVEFMANVKGVAPGQSAVFYEGNDVVGGGIISSSSLGKMAIDN
jgi:tRNA-specific 2-thiouridylase